MKKLIVIFIITVFFGVNSRAVFAKNDQKGETSHPIYKKVFTFE